MRTKLRLLIFNLALLALAASTASAASAASLRSDVLGLRLEMSKEVVHQRLAKVGQLEKEERGRQEVWTLRNDPSFATLLVGYDGSYKVRYVTALARKDGRPLRYSEIAPLKTAHSENAKGVYQRYVWEVKPDAKHDGYFLFAEGRDPQYLNSISIKQHTKKSAGAEEDDDQF